MLVHARRQRAQLGRILAQNFQRLGSVLGIDAVPQTRVAATLLAGCGRGTARPDAIAPPCLARRSGTC
jgi:hypothetical protein